MALSQYDSPPLLESKEDIREYLLKLHQDVYGLGNDISGSLSFTDNLIDPPDITGTTNESFTIDTDFTGGDISLIFGNQGSLIYDESASEFVLSDCIKINNDMFICTGSITSDSGAIDFDNENLSTTGTLTSGELTLTGDIVMSDNDITGVGDITFTDCSVGTIGGIICQNLLDKTATETITGSPWIFQNSSDSTTSFQILDSDGGTPILSVDTTNERIGIGTDTPNEILDVVGNVGVTGDVSLTSITVDSGTIIELNTTVVSAGSSRTGDTSRSFIFRTPEYLEANLDFLAFQATANATNNSVKFGGGAGSLNSATQVLFYSSAAVNTLSGTEMMRFIGGNTMTINESGVDIDFRIEGVGEANALFVQGSDGYVGIFNNTPTVPLTVAGTGLFTSTNQLQFGDSGTYINQGVDGSLDLNTDNRATVNGRDILSMALMGAT